jgi:hypothetical protein
VARINAVYFPEIVDLNKDNKLDLIAGLRRQRARLGTAMDRLHPAPIRDSIEPVNTGGGAGIGAILAGH